MKQRGKRLVNKNTTLFPIKRKKDLTKSICNARHEVQLIKEGKLKAKSINELIAELPGKVDEARAEYAKGNFVRCSNKQELKDFLDSL